MGNCTTCKNHTESEWSDKPCFACDGKVNDFYEKADDEK